VRVFPSPAEAVVNIEITSQTSGIAQVHITNTLGATLLRGEHRIQTGLFRVGYDIQSLPDGVYFVRVQLGSAAWVEKIIKQ
jgi:hypothetical protein